VQRKRIVGPFLNVVRRMKSSDPGGAVWQSSAGGEGVGVRALNHGEDTLLKRLSTAAVQSCFTAVKNNVIPKRAIS